MIKRPPETSTARFVYRRPDWMIAEVNRRTSNDVSCFTNDETQPTIGMKEREPISARVHVDSALADARDLPFPHQSLDQRDLDAKAFPDQFSVHTDGAFFKLNVRHGYLPNDAIGLRRIFDPLYIAKR